MLIVLVCPLPETVTDPPPPAIGSPNELKVTVKLLPITTPDGSRPEESRFPTGLKVYTVGVAVEKVTVFETLLAIADSWAYRISEAII